MALRTANFYWVNMKKEPTPFKGNFFFALYSFLILHPHWETRLWTNNEFSGEWFQRCLDKGLVVKKIDLSDYPYKSHTNPSFIVDYYKCKTLAEEGGLICDLNDSVTIRCHDLVWDQADKLMWSNYCGPSNGILSGGWMLKNSPSKLMQELIKQPVQNNKGLHYELIAPDLIPKYPDDCCQDFCNPKIMFPIFNGDIPAALSSGDFTTYITKDTCQIHWFFGNIYESDYHWNNRKHIANQSDLSDWWHKKGAYVDSFRLALKNANDPLEHEILATEKRKPEAVGQRQVHFVWVSTQDGDSADFKGWMYMAIRSFQAWHPEWKVNLWTNCSFNESAQLTECKSLGLKVKPFNLEKMFPHDGVDNPAMIADYVKVWALFNYGGMVMDLDTVTFGNFDNIYDMAATLEWGWYGRQPERKDKFLMCWLCCNKPGNNFLKMLMQISPRSGNGRPSYDKLTAVLYQDYPNDVSRYPTDWQMLTPTYAQWIRTVLDSKSIKASLNSTMKMYHWYYSDFDDDTIWSREKKRLIDSETEMTPGWENRRSAYVELFKIAMERAPK